MQQFVICNAERVTFASSTTFIKVFRSLMHPFYVFIDIIYLLVSFLDTPHVFFLVAAFYQIWQASVFHDTLSQLPYLWYPNDIFPLCSPTFLVLKENLFNKYNIPYFTEVNLINVLLTLHISINTLKIIK